MKKENEKECAGKALEYQKPSLVSFEKMDTGYGLCADGTGDTADGGCANGPLNLGTGCQVGAGHN